MKLTARTFATLIACSLAALGLTAGSAAAATNSRGFWSFVSAPGLHPASVAVTRSSSRTAPGDLFVAPITQPGHVGGLAGQHGPEILDPSGNPIWSNPVSGGSAANFQAQLYNGAPVLTWWQGTITPAGYGTGVDVIMDSSYRTVAVVRGAGHWVPDLHDFVLTPQGTAYVTAYHVSYHNLSRYGGSSRGPLLDSIVEEIDVRTGRVLWQWDPLHHVGLSESYTVPTNGYSWDAYHLNSIALDSSGNLLVSARNTWAVYMISRRTGAVLWRLGGKHSNFKLARGVRFAYQHDARFAPGGVSVFDNGGDPRVERQSRGLVVRLDTRHHTASVARQFTHPGGLAAGSQGDVQFLPNGDVFEGWGAKPYLSEYSASGALVFDAHFHGADESYRAFREPWSGQPVTPPSAAATAAGNGTTVYASWNGATAVGSWQVLAGPSASALAPVATAGRNGFETSIAVASGGPYFAVRALDASGNTLGTSPTVQRH